jgi:hypothetical protein
VKRRGSFSFLRGAHILRNFLPSLTQAAWEGKSVEGFGPVIAFPRAEEASFNQG